MRKPIEGPLASLRLTARQIDVLALLLHGHSNKAIANELFLSIETVKDHVGDVLSTLGVPSRARIPLLVQAHHQELLDWDRSRIERLASGRLGTPRK
ncbi:MAG: helix-turn-helix transcriptional regulator [Caldimonas sp.]